MYYPFSRNDFYSALVNTHTGKSGMTSLSEKPLPPSVHKKTRTGSSAMFLPKSEADEAYSSVSLNPGSFARVTLISLKSTLLDYSMLQWFYQLSLPES